MSRFTRIPTITTRRAVLAGIPIAAASMVPAAATALGGLAPSVPGDAELIELGRQLLGTWAEENRVLAKWGDDEGPAATREIDEAMDAAPVIVDRIRGIPASTFGGIRGEGYCHYLLSGCLHRRSTGRRHGQQTYGIDCSGLAHHAGDRWEGAIMTRKERSVEYLDRHGTEH